MNTSTYRYEAYSTDGRRHNGTLASTSRIDALNSLHGQGLIVTELQADSAGRRTPLLPRVLPATERIFFLHQLSALLGCGISLATALSMLATSMESPTWHTILTRMEQDLSRGQSASNTFRSHRYAFGDLLPFLVEVGELSGRLEEMLLRAASIMESQREFRKRLGDALRYPLIVLTSLLGAFVFAVTMIIPRFADIFARSEATLPLLTRFLLGLSSFFSHYGIILLSTLLLTAAALLAVHRRVPGARNFLFRMGLRFPLLGTILQISMVSHLFMTLKTMLQGGIPLAAAMEMVRDTTANPLLRQELQLAHELLNQGAPFHAALEACTIFPGLAVQMARTGEEGGTLEQMLEKTATFYEQQAQQKLRTLAGYTEPLLLLLSGVFVLILALGILLPMWQVTRL